MPSAIDAGDRRLLIVGGTILVVLIAVTVVVSPSANDAEGQGTPTTYSTARNGTQAAYLLLGELGYRSVRWEQSPAELPEDGKGKILILAGPTDFPDKTEREALERFARGGGWILYAGDFPFLFLGKGNIAPAPLESRSNLTSNLTGEAFPAIAPSPLTRDAPEVTMLARNRWARSEGAQVPLYGKANQPVVVTWKFDKGRIVWWAAATPITNSGISREGNLPFFLDCIQAVWPGAAPQETTVLWDEYFHGYKGSLWSYFAETPVPWAILQIGLVALFAVFSFGRRSGPVYTPASVSRLSPLEFVDTLGDLYRRANAGPAAVRVAYQRLRTELLRRLALTPATSNAQLEAAVRERLGWKQPGLMDTLQRADMAGRTGELSSHEALKLVQALEHYEVLFGLKKQTEGEKH